MVNRSITNLVEDLPANQFMDTSGLAIPMNFKYLIVFD